MIDFARVAIAPGQFLELGGDVALQHVIAVRVGVARGRGVQEGSEGSACDNGVGGVLALFLQILGKLLRELRLTSLG